MTHLNQGYNIGDPNWSNFYLNVDKTSFHSIYYLHLINATDSQQMLHKIRCENVCFRSTVLHHIRAQNPLNPKFKHTRPARWVAKLAVMRSDILRDGFLSMNNPWQIHIYRLTVYSVISHMPSQLRVPAFSVSLILSFASRVDRVALSAPCVYASHNILHVFTVRLH